MQAVRVIDTPGLADSDRGNRLRVREGNRLGVFEANLAMFRDLLRRRAKSSLRIHRVLYFLPCRGPLESADAVLQEEIEVMQHFFGNAIFDCMVLVATLYKGHTSLTFTEEDKALTTKRFDAALKLSDLEGDQPKCPPVIFIGFADTGVDIQREIESARVVSNEGFNFDQFVRGTCSKCAANYLCRKEQMDDPNKRLSVMVRVKSEEEEGEERKFVPYKSSKCHPLFIPKYSYWERVAGGAAHVATLGIPMIIHKLRTGEIPWPTFTSNDEMCLNCEQSPGSRGCTEVLTMYKATMPTGESKDMTVDHTNQLDDFFKNIDDI